MRSVSHIWAKQRRSGGRRTVGLVACAVASILLAAAAPAGASTLDQTTHTSLSVSPTETTVGATVTLTATVEGVGGNPTGTVEFDNNTTSGPMVIGVAALTPVAGSGTASRAVLETGSFAAGSYAITATYKTSNVFEFFNSTSASAPLTVSGIVLHNTAMTLSANPTTLTQGQQVTLKAKVSELEGGALPSGVVTFTAGPSAGQSEQVLIGTAQLDSSGVATLEVGGWIAGTYLVHASYEGDKVDRSAGASLTLQVNPAASAAVQTTTTVSASPNPVVAGQAVSITAHVVQAGTATPPPAAALVTFTGSNGVHLGEAALDAKGNATISVAGWIPGSYRIQASYVGDIFDRPSSGQAQLEVIPPAPKPVMVPTNTHADVSGALIGEGAVITLIGTLTNGETGEPEQGEPLTLSLGSQSCFTGPTSAQGKASCTVTVSGPLGPTTSKAHFSGDGLLQPSDDNEPALLYGLAPGGGAFVVGDGSASIGATVTFWGAQWWKQNALSGGAAPAAFKGFALTPSAPACGMPWSTGPGNSPPPPQGPLPAYMAVIVTGAASQSGPSIGGWVDHVAIVTPNGGYAADPGHAGGGTVVATVC